MPSKHTTDVPQAGINRAWLLVVASAAVFCLLAAMPVILPALHLQLQAPAAKSSHGVTLRPAPSAPHAVSLASVAQPIDPNGKPASLPAVNGTKEAAAVNAEDSRIRTMLHDAGHIFSPEVIPTRGALPTLVLTAGQSTYTASSLVQYGALVMLPNNAALLLDNVFVSTNARLSLGSSRLRTLYLDNGSGGFATIVAWGGNLSFQGASASRPMTITGWDRTDNAAATDAGQGRSYIREVGGKMTMTNVRVSSLGFWSGRTGGVAWTGLIGSPSTGGATRTTFTDNTYGAFVSRGSGVAFRDDLFEFNELDGLHIHRYSDNSSVTASSASRNGGNGFIVSPSTVNTLLTGDVSEHNAKDGYFVNGKPLATGASASGGSVTPGSGTIVKDSSALNNEEIGILIEGGTGTVIEGDQVCASVTAVAVRYDVTNAVLTGNDIGCNPRSGFSIGPSTPGLTVSGNTVAGPRTAFLVSNSGPIELDNNRVTGATVFGISARGESSKIKGVGNVISGTGFRAVDARADASAPALSATNSSGWAYHGKVSFWSYLRFHPLAALWLGISILVLFAWLWSRRRRLPSHPYPASTRWSRNAPAAESAPATSGLAPARAAPPAPAMVAASAAAPAFVTAHAEAPAPAQAQAPVHSAPAGPAPVPAMAGVAATGGAPGRGWRVASTVPFRAITGALRPDGALAGGRGQRHREQTSSGSRVSPTAAGYGAPTGNGRNVPGAGQHRNDGHAASLGNGTSVRHGNGSGVRDSWSSVGGQEPGAYKPSGRHGRPDPAPAWPGDSDASGTRPEPMIGGEAAWGSSGSSPEPAAADRDNYFDAFSARPKEGDTP
jgi:Right handed beta helix region